MVETLRRLLDAEEFEFIDRPAVVRAVASYETGDADLSDYLIGESAAARGAAGTCTFDRALWRTRGSSGRVERGQAEAVAALYVYSRLNGG
ncbi:MAG: hypothetical protein OXM56_08575 [Gammaproteobacteria bacterium]|nr:hypothetical protein [Gammaproteobacteria bacterium]